MHVSSYLACEKIQVELALFRESITISIGECNYGSNMSVTFLGFREAPGGEDGRGRPRRVRA